MKKRGQITVFIVLGFVILTVFVFINNAANDSQRIKFENQAKDVKATLEQSKTIQHYVTLCLQDSAEESLYLIGQQGGRIWNYQNGSSKMSNFYASGDLNISVGLLAPKLKPKYASSIFYDVNLYPTNSIDYINMSDFYYLGDNIFPSLCETNGPNSFDNSKLWSGVSCTPSDVNPYLSRREYFGVTPETMQLQLANYASKTITKCIDRNFLKEYTGYDISFNSPEINVTFGEDNVIFNANFPIDIKLQSNDSFIKRNAIITKETSFSVSLPVRLKMLYDFSYSIVDEDSRNITFVLLNDYHSKKSYKKLVQNYKDDDVSVTVSPKDTFGSSVDLISIEDKISLINGKPYIFQFLRENRPPALDYIGDKAYPYDMMIPVNDNINFYPKGYDPDEDYYSGTSCIDNKGNKCMNRFYNYSEWLENEYYFFNVTCCMNLVDRSKCEDNIINGGCVTRSNLAQHTWTKSFPYSLNFRDANYTTKMEDLGNHTVNISVCDEHGVCDWQEVKIRVYDIPTYVIDYTNFFPDINQSYASVEDPYILNAKMTNMITTPLTTTRFTWIDSTEPFNIITVSTTTRLLPNDTYNIENIKPTTTLSNPSHDYMIFGNFGESLGKKSISHKIDLYANSQPLSDTQNIIVYQCLPHHNNSASFPFNNFSGDNGFVSYTDINDSFQADHTCCMEYPATDYGTYSPQTSICYNFTSYAPFWGFNDSRFTGLKTERNDLSTVKFSDYSITWNYYLNSNIGNTQTPITTHISDTKTYPTSNFQLPPYTYSTLTSTGAYNFNNDVYERSFDTKCNGVRGNICDNNPSEIRQPAPASSNSNPPIGACADDLKPNQEEKCSGPNQRFFVTNTNGAITNIISENNSNADICVNYPTGDSFEKEIYKKVNSLVTSGSSQDKFDGQCSEVYKCVSSNNYAITTSAISTPFLAKGLCKSSDGTCTYAYAAPGGTDYDATKPSPNTFYKFDKTPGITFDADNTIDCRCYARSARLGSFKDSTLTNYDTYSQTLLNSNSCDYSTTKHVCIWDATAVAGQSDKWSPDDNEADLVNYTFNNPSGISLGQCTSGRIFNCKSGSNDGCAEETSGVSNIIILNSFVYSSGEIKLRQYLPYDSDNVCGTKETCSASQDIELDSDKTACQLLRWSKTGNIPYVYNGGKINNGNGDVLTDIIKVPYYFDEHYQSYSPVNRQCCGDDKGETEDETPCFSSLICLSDNKRKGCRVLPECVYDNVAYPNSQPLNVGGDSQLDYCDAGTWKDCNADDGHCDKSTKWCVGVSSSDTSQTASPLHDCIPRLPDGSICNRDNQCTGSDTPKTDDGLCKQDYFGTNRCTSPNKCMIDDKSATYNGNSHCSSSTSGPYKMCNGEIWSSANSCINGCYNSQSFSPTCTNNQNENNVCGATGWNYCDAFGSNHCGCDSTPSAFAGRPAGAGASCQSNSCGAPTTDCGPNSCDGECGCGKSNTCQYTILKGSTCTCTGSQNGCGYSIPMICNAPTGCDNKCGSTKVWGCDGICNSGKVYGGCDNKCGSTKVIGGCDNACGSTKVIGGCDNKCGSTKVLGCDGVCGSGKVIGGCDNKCGSTAVVDCLGICGGNADCNIGAGGGGGGGCFLAGTPVMMGDGTKKNIEDIKVGDYVLTYNQINKTVTFGKVLKLLIHPNIQGYWLVNNILNVTPNHRMLINNEWKHLWDAKIGDNFTDSSGNNVRLNSIKIFNSTNTVYNFEVEEYHTYYVNNILVHNDK